MEPLSTIEGVAALLPDDDLDTDAIYPARFLLLMNKTGLRQYAFYDRRFSSDALERPEFILNQPPWRDARILVAGRNFGCGSSREQAVWTLRDFGIQCVIAISFGEIFFSNCLQNGVLPIRLSAVPWQIVARAALAGKRFCVELTTQFIRVEDAPPIEFEVEPAHREALLTGWDATELILRRAGAAIASFEDRHRQTHPWLF